MVWVKWVKEVVVLNSAVEGRERKKGGFQQGQRMPHILPKPPKTCLNIGSEANKGMVSQTHVARPPAEGRGCNQLLPRYWPRISDQELQQISGEYPLLCYFWVLIFKFFHNQMRCYVCTLVLFIY